MSVTPFRLIDLFAGIGGFSLGLERSGGFRTIKFCEMEPHARAVLAKNFPGIPHHEDVTTYDFREGEADAISAGFPCQDISFAGNGAGLAGSRSGLYREVIRALRLVRPKYAVLENVAALLSRGLDTILWDLAEIGYDAEWHCIPASAVGAPHRRDRIWIIAHARSEQHEGGSPTFSGALAQELLAKDTDATGERCGEAGQLRYVESPEWSPGLCEDVADAPGEWRDGCWSGAEPARRRELADGGSAMADAASCGQQRPGDVQGESRQAGQPICSTWWAVEPDVGRVAHGVPARVDRLTRLGNSVVPQIPEIIGRAIMSVALPPSVSETP